jgi:hypothetical protein
MDRKGLVALAAGYRAPAAWKWLVGDEADAVVTQHRRAPGDPFVRRQVALRECLENHA